MRGVMGYTGPTALVSRQGQQKKSSVRYLTGLPTFHIKTVLLVRWVNAGKNVYELCMEYQARLTNHRLKCDKARPRTEQLTTATNAVETTCLRHAGLILQIGILRERKNACC